MNFEQWLAAALVFALGYGMGRWQGRLAWERRLWGKRRIELRGAAFYRRRTRGTRR